MSVLQEEDEVGGNLEFRIIFLKVNVTYFIIIRFSFENFNIAQVALATRKSSPKSFQKESQKESKKESQNKSQKESQKKSQKDSHKESHKNPKGGLKEFQMRLNFFIH